MPEHQQQQAAVAGPVAAAFGGVEQLFDLEAGEVLAAAVLFLPAARPPPRFSCFRSAHRFVESLSCPRPLKPLQTGQGAFRLSTKCRVLSRVNTEGTGQGKKGNLANDTLPKLRGNFGDLDIDQSRSLGLEPITTAI